MAPRSRHARDLDDPSDRVRVGAEESGQLADAGRRLVARDTPPSITYFKYSAGCRRDRDWPALVDASWMGVTPSVLEY
jgi:hypothetical protein